ncbi:formimidoylglutamate deiminase [Pseudonocardia asaccharolytica]|uniref:Formimidoylglutamate deiminase n=1 Tax=Pseudonocardia asaccharolytica DSM 44247 = NBRC 16224 TaxID=1123024 RepID=A0A511D1B7_9PSEU|nr:formimidoylglutamate deiminase [Pseudonocardia asaccharolytica]GEL17334.1 formimidoylglutamate deiminase [Pseudonocardia asaccharolytica DSM 44247 = NBRC 16224]
MSRWFAAEALLPGGPATDVVFEIVEGRFATITADADAGGAARLPGIALPGLANAHSHAFHRALRGRTHGCGGTFWTWRERMYALARRLDPDTYLALARATYAEMALAGFTAVGEFHYLHHGPGGVPYTEPNAMAAALRQAAADAGVRLTLIDICYLAGGLGPGGHLPLDEVQRPFSDGDPHAWAERVAELAAGPGMRIGVGVHSVRAVPRPALRTVAEIARARPLHVHLSEQPAENEACLGYYGATPTGLLAAEGVLGPGTTAVHATHLTGADIALLGDSGATVCLCPTTERDLADGIGPARALRDAGVRLALGTDQHALIDPFEEARALEMHERLASGERGRFAPDELLAALTGHGCLGWPDAGRLEVGARADLVAVRCDTARTAGAAPDQILYAATAADVDTVIVDGQPVVEGGRHRLGDVGALLRAAIEPLRECG